jgi:hypothetical protein
MPAGLPCGRPGSGLLIDGAMQQAPQPGRQSGVASGVGCTDEGDEVGMLHRRIEIGRDYNRRLPLFPAVLRMFL